MSGVAGAFEALASPERHAKIIVEPWRDRAGSAPGERPQ